MPLPGIEPGLRLSQSRVPPPHSKDKYPTEESNLARLLRRQSCVLHTRGAKQTNIYRSNRSPNLLRHETIEAANPDLESKQDLDLRRVQYGPQDHRTAVEADQESTISEEFKADDWIRTSFIPLTGRTPFSSSHAGRRSPWIMRATRTNRTDSAVSPHEEHERKDSNLVWRFWRPHALPGAHSYCSPSGGLPTGTGIYSSSSTVQ